MYLPWTDVVGHPLCDRYLKHSNIMTTADDIPSAVVAYCTRSVIRLALDQIFVEKK
jgi:hypothetical protein